MDTDVRKKKNCVFVSTIIDSICLNKFQRFVTLMNIASFGDLNYFSNSRSIFSQISLATIIQDIFAIAKVANSH